MHWHCWWDYHQRSEFVIGKCHSCSNYDIGLCAILWSRDSVIFVQFRDLVTSRLIDLMIRFWSEHLHVWGIVNLGCHGFYNHDLRAIYETVNLDVVVEELQRGILVLCCLRPNWPESILSVAFVQVASFWQSRLVCTTWICWNQFLANRIRDLFCFDRTSLNPLFWWNQNSLNCSVNWVVVVWRCQRLFPLTLFVEEEIAREWKQFLELTQL